MPSVTWNMLVLHQWSVPCLMGTTEQTFSRVSFRIPRSNFPIRVTWWLETAPYPHYTLLGSLLSELLDLFYRSLDWFLFGWLFFFLSKLLRLSIKKTYLRKDGFGSWKLVVSSSPFPFQCVFRSEKLYLRTLYFFKKAHKHRGVQKRVPFQNISALCCVLL